MPSNCFSVSCSPYLATTESYALRLSVAVLIYPMALLIRSGSSADFLVLVAFFVGVGITAGSLGLI